jgi:hypothetical protein
MSRNDGYNPTAEQQQDMDNLSFDRKYRVNATENLVENTAGDDIVRMKQPMKDTTATDGTQKTQITTALINFVFDSIYLAEPDTVTEVYTYKLSGDTVATITIIYTDAEKETLVSCIRS